MRGRTRVALLAVLAAGFALPAAGPADAAECVKVVVDYGTIPGSPAGPNTRCVDVPAGGTAAEALRGRARYKGDFLCAIDGYPESGCGDEPPSPYWSIWYWSNGRWVYSQEGVGTLEVADRDRDGHPDPFGFRYHEVDRRSAPRANPSYPKPSPSATRPAAPASSRPARPPATSAPAATARTGGATTAPTAAGSSGAASTPRTARPAPATSSAGQPAATGTPATTTPAAPDGASVGAIPPVPDGGGLPVGTVLGGVVALGLLAATAVRLRRPAA